MIYILKHIAALESVKKPGVLGTLQLYQHDI